MAEMADRRGTTLQARRQQTEGEVAYIEGRVLAEILTEHGGLQPLGVSRDIFLAFLLEQKKVGVLLTSEGVFLLTDAGEKFVELSSPAAERVREVVGKKHEQGLNISFTAQQDLRQEARWQNLGLTQPEVNLLESIYNKVNRSSPYGYSSAEETYFIKPIVTALLNVNRLITEEGRDSIKARQELEKAATHLDAFLKFLESEDTLPLSQASGLNARSYWLTGIAFKVLGDKVAAAGSFEKAKNQFTVQHKRLLAEISNPNVPSYRKIHAKRSLSEVEQSLKGVEQSLASIGR